MRPSSEGNRRRIGVLVAGPEGFAATLRARLDGIPVSTNVADLIRQHPGNQSELYDLLFVLLASMDGPTPGEFARAHELAEVVASIVVTGGDGASGESAHIAAVREMSDLVLWSPDESLLADLCEMLG